VLKRKRQQVLLGTEEALLPETQDYARVERYRRQVLDMKSGLYEDLLRAKHEVANISHVLTETSNLANELKEVIDGHRPLQDQHMMMIGVDQDAGAGLDAAGAAAGAMAGAAAAAGARRRFIKRCPVGTCTGYLSMQYKCGMCEVRVCPKCLEPTVVGEAHTCDEGTVATVQALMRDTKPCPSCAAPIMKVSGCDQMWCTLCHTAFSWVSLRVVTGQVHNPHWYEWQRQQAENGGEAMRTPGDEPHQPCVGEREGVPGLREFPLAKRTPLLMTIHRLLIHVQNVTLPTYPGDFRMQDNRDLRIKFLMGELTQDAWKRSLEQRDKRRDREVAMRNVWEVFLNGAAYILRSYIRLERVEYKGHTDMLDSLLRLREYVNETLRSVQIRFDCRIFLISEEWALERKL
jgi:hypothetical protein